jgi:hypothetical protein
MKRGSVPVSIDWNIAAVSANPVIGNRHAPSVVAYVPNLGYVDHSRSAAFDERCACVRQTLASDGRVGG